MTWHHSKSPYVMMWGGEFRPVIYLCVGPIEVQDPTTAVAAVLYVSESEWIKARVYPGDVVRRPTRSGSPFLTID